MCSCITKSRPAPIIDHATVNGTICRDSCGIPSKKPTKKITAPVSTYDGLTMCVEKLRVQGSVKSDVQISQRGKPGSRRDTYQASSASAANDSTFRNTMGDSGAAQIASGKRINQPSNAPGTWPPVHTTSAPKYGHSPRAKDCRPMR